MTRGRTRASAAAILVSAGLFAASCTGGTSSTTPTSAISQIASTAKLKIVSPNDGQVVHGSTVDVKVDLEDAKIVVPTTTDVRPDEGHLHILIDDRLLTMTASLDQNVPDVSPGQHLLKVEFVAGNHVPFDPPVLDEVGFKVVR
jgi:hypothetical protein